ncbi:hypothetical protein [Desulfospira joergensenii]|uniref:hypothetical protein n=1 Tax=Desulfospira joergensenii TaxID=53329 RepID=UPI00040A2B17|nr:hypothetical protein [Desulfospira joergensenii]
MKIQETGINKPQANLQSLASSRPGNAQFSHMLLGEISDNKESREKSGPMVLGTITRDTPTISQLLFKSPLKEECWNIIYNPVNGKKPFHRIRPGTEVVYDPDSKELLWGKDLKEFLAQNDPKPETTVWNRESSKNLPEFESENKTAELSTAVKNFIGQDYDNMDCYELLVGGLRELGVQYRGKDGLGRHLINQALEKGLPKNYFLNGEGLVSESGTSVFKKTIFRVNDPKTQAATLMDEMKDLLAEGQILSFSMKNKGHTGVISKTPDQWTFINSGDMDHNLSGENGSKKVGEEDLESELMNWFQLASESRQGLKITLGTLNIDRLSMFRPNRFSRRV